MAGKASNGTEFIVKVGKWAGALIALVALTQTMGGLALRWILLPPMERLLQEERAARERADAVLTERTERTRVVIAALLDDPTPAERRRLMAQLTEGWARYPEDRR